MLTGRGWGGTWARRLARTGALAAGHPSVAGPWAAGIITSEHIDPVARAVDRLTSDELAAVLTELAPLWGQLTPSGVARFVASVIQVLHPPPDPSPDEVDAHETRTLSFAFLADSVVLTGSLPRIEGELVIAAIDAVAERLRSSADHVPPGARRADALVELVNSAHAAGVLPTRGGLPVSLSVTLRTTDTGDQVWTTSRGHLLTESEQRFVSCDAQVIPILVGGDECGAEARLGTPQHWPSVSPGDRIAALARTLLGAIEPLAVGRAARTATPAQRRALAIRDNGCIIPGCGVVAEACQVHHVTPWAEGGESDLRNMTLLCWAHHRQVDLGMWTIRPADPAHPPIDTHHGAPPGTPWPANHRAPWTITRTPRHHWRT
jgi:hypothetical protein